MAYGDVHTETLKQYAWRRRDEMYKEAIREDAAGGKPELPDVPRGALDDLYPDHYFFNDYIAAARERAQSGIKLTPQVLDCLYNIRPGLFFSLMHDYPSAIPEGYLNPGARELNNTMERASREIRRGNKRRKPS